MIAKDNSAFMPPANETESTIELLEATGDLGVYLPGKDANQLGAYIREIESELKERGENMADARVENATREYILELISKKMERLENENESLGGESNFLHSHLSELLAEIVNSRTYTIGDSRVYRPQLDKNKIDTLASEIRVYKYLMETRAAKMKRLISDMLDEAISYGEYILPVATIEVFADTIDYELPE